MRRNLALILLFGWVPVALGVFLLSEFWLQQPFLTLGVIIGWFVAACGMIWWAGEFRCPRCRRRYGAVGSRKGVNLIWRGLFDSICNNCKLRKFENFNSEGSNPGSLDRRMARD
ncbi:hypothetical protein AciX9_0018 [Granulicella tundricola MP5ACTX9]|uniref:Uncharacterized protein n=2 Tax=Granulicella TaxID=940557 RepID=E8X449_GRATM|nr:hypothetical protein AciX9_0018 [Granulicella tundricola MP5ACTX9]